MGDAKLGAAAAAVLVSGADKNKVVRASAKIFLSSATS